MRNFVRPFFVVVSVACALAARGQQRIETGPITATVGGEVVSVQVEADQPELRRLATLAFSAHGAFRVEAAGRAGYRLRFAVAGPSAVRVTVESVRPAQVVLARDVSGTSLGNALLRAADAAVLQLTRQPGFFGGRLAFVSEQTGASEIYTSDVFFGEVLRFTSDRSQSMTPRWSPDGRKILYTGYFRNGYPDIYVIDTATRSREVFVSVKGTNTGGRFSPDGARAAMVLSGSGNPEVYVGDARGGGLRRLTRTERQIEATPTWSPDGNRLVVASDALATGKPQLFLLGVQGGALQRLPANISGYCAEPDWSHANPDLVAFTYAAGGAFQVAVFSFKEQAAHGVSRVPGDGIEPCWASDGRHLFLTSRSAGSQRIYLLDTVTGKATALSPASLGKCFQASFVYR